MGHLTVERIAFPRTDSDMLGVSLSKFTIDCYG
jgi:hypothetical protein